MSGGQAMKAGSGASVPHSVRRRWSGLGSARLERIGTGLINLTWRAQCPGGHRLILQRLHPMFDAEINRNIRAVTRRLADRGFVTPELVRCDNGDLYCIDAGQCWRVLTHVDGTSFDAVTSPTMAREAGRLVGEFHGAMAGFDYDYVGQRNNVHDTASHLAHLRSTLATNPDHRHFARVVPLAERVLAAAANYPEIDALPKRHAHGDLKISNLLYDAHGNALCLIDLDTVSRMPWALEMGDALRSWCNPRTEDQLRADLDLEILDAALAGYASAAPDWLSATEATMLIDGLERICLELAARFLADAINERYFGWDRVTYTSAGDHNLARGNAMTELYRDVCRKREDACAIVRTRLGEVAR